MVARNPHAVLNGAELKRCGTCKAWKPLDEFFRSKHRWDGLTNACKACIKPGNMRWKIQNHDYVLEKAREYGAINRTRSADRMARWRQANPERDLANRLAWLEANGERRRATQQAWKEANPDRVRENGRRGVAKRRARKRSLAVELWTEQQVIDRDGFACWINGCAIGDVLRDGRRDWAIDHLIPLARYYPQHPGNTFANVGIACHSCNSWKKNKLLPEAIARYEANLLLT